MWDVAEELGALLVFAEHRYYGESLPFGDKAYSSPQTLQYLSSAQALADFAVLIEHIRGTVPGVGDSPVVAVGGSYGGMLAAWLRMKYPQSVVGALAASAPIWQFTGLAECGAYARIVTRTFQTRGGAACPHSVRRSWAAIDHVASTVDGLRWLGSTFRLCAPLGGPGDVLALKAWLAETWGDLAMVDYPYAASFLQPLPAFPVHAVCSHLQEPEAPDGALLQAVVRAVSVYYNHTGASACFNTSQSATASLGMQGWDYQACTEMVMPACSDGEVDMFEAAPWDEAAFAEGCRRTWGVLPRPAWAPTLYGGRNITEHTNIVFSNGGLDPWSGGGVTRSLSPSLPALLIPDGAHHADLRSNCAQDPDSFLHARRAEVALIQQWVKEAHHQRQLQQQRQPQQQPPWQL
ncbi:lysosomal Pro-X carboxypeptidase [Lampetra fluviatilis]